MAVAADVDGLRLGGLPVGGVDGFGRSRGHRGLLTVAGYEIDNILFIAMVTIIGVVLVVFFAAALRRVSGRRWPSGWPACA